MPADMMPHCTAEASEEQIRRTMQASDQTICEWVVGGFTFIRSNSTKTIVRTGALGGDTREIHGGWFYLNPFSLALDWSEIISLPGTRVYTR